jgi:hypothetical protein
MRLGQPNGKENEGNHKAYLKKKYRMMKSEKKISFF